MTKRPRVPLALRDALRHHGTVPSKRDPGPSVDEWADDLDEHPKGASRKSIEPLED